MRYCGRCGVQREANCAIVCWAERTHDDLSDTDHTLYVTDSSDDAA